MYREEEEGLAHQTWRPCNLFFYDSKLISVAYIINFVIDPVVSSIAMSEAQGTIGCV